MKKKQLNTERCINLLLPVQSQYQVLDYFTEKFYEALKKLGVKCQLLKVDYRFPEKFLDFIIKDHPDYTLAFNCVLPGNIVPHITCTVDAPQYYLPMINRQSILTCVDKDACEVFEEIGCRKILFMPHAADADLYLQLKKPFSLRRYEVSFFSSLQDYEEILKKWKIKYNNHFYELLLEVAENTLMDQNLSYSKAFANVINQNKERVDSYLKNIDMIEVLFDLESYINSKDRVKMISAIKDAKVHIFGSNGQLWRKFLGSQPNIIIHNEVSFKDALELMKESQIVLNTCPKIKHGAHERFFSAILCGAVVLSEENPFLKSYFNHEESVLFFRSGFWSEINDLINEYLFNSLKKQALVTKSQEIVMNSHTWDHRASLFLHFLDRCDADNF